MTRTPALAVLVVLSFVATVTLAQSPPTTVEPRLPGVTTAPPQPADALATTARLHHDVDARACLEFPTNIGVIRCAEKYRHGAQQLAH